VSAAICLSSGFSWKSAGEHGMTMGVVSPALLRHGQSHWTVTEGFHRTLGTALQLNGLCWNFDAKI
jgi:hypothetical protein